ncbi:MAG: MarR family winged helix-turn-helix transcriptional regulator [Raoultibacter sp.]|jgi:DNA-binding MarR family transcriptional regulator
MASLPSSAKQELLNLMRRLKRENFHSHVTQGELTPSEASVVFGIYIARDRGVDPIQPRNVAHWLHLTPSALSQTLKVLEEKGFIDRKRSKEDSRSVSLELTEKGSAFAAKGVAERDAFMDEFIEYMGEDEVKQLIASLEKVLEFKNLKCPHSCPHASTHEKTACE